MSTSSILSRECDSHDYMSDDIECPQCDGSMMMNWEDKYTYRCDDCRLKLVACNWCERLFEEEDDTHLYVKHPLFHRPQLGYISTHCNILCLSCSEHSGGFHIEDELDHEYQECPQCSGSMMHDYEMTTGKCWFYQCYPCDLVIVACRTCDASFEYNDDRHLFTKEIDVQGGNTYISTKCIACAGGTAFLYKVDDEYQD